MKKFVFSMFVLCLLIGASAVHAQSNTAVCSIERTRQLSEAQQEVASRVWADLQRLFHVHPGNLSGAFIYVTLVSIGSVPNEYTVVLSSSRPKIGQKGGITKIFWKNDNVSFNLNGNLPPDLFYNKKLESTISVAPFPCTVSVFHTEEFVKYFGSAMDPAEEK